MTMLFSCGSPEDAVENEMQQENNDPNMRDNLDPPSHAAPDDEADLRMTDPAIGGHTMMPTQLITENITSNMNLTTFASLIRKGEIVDVLAGTGPYTIFAPSNEAFESLPEGVLENLTDEENQQRLKELLNNHIVTGAITNAELLDATTLNTVGGERLTVTKRGGNVMVNGAEVVEGGIISDNGVIHVVDKVLTVEN